MKTARHPHQAWKIVLLSLALLPLVYVGSYFAVLALPPSVRLPSFLSARPNGIQTRFVETNREWAVYPDYHGLPPWLYAPLHEYDRTHLRPAHWSGTYPHSDQELSFDWLLGPSASSAKPMPP